jgi:NAD(P)-dependent dehydrogenase (short-subunit alcohol dehydrogenase family)
MTHDFKNKVLLITGAGKGKGRALAEAFAGLGALIAVNDVSPINLEQLVEQGGGKIKAYTDDIAKKVAIQSIINQVQDDFGHIDILINHAAVEPRSPLLDMDEWDWHRTLDVNLTGAFLATQSVGRVMREQGSGVIVNLISAGLSQREGTQTRAAYMASMYGLLALTCAAAAELARFGIHVHAAGNGLAEFRQAETAAPGGLVNAVLELCESSSTGRIVNVEEQ